MTASIALTSERIFHNRMERLIAFGRSALAIVSLQALLLAPPEPVRFAPVTAAILTGYTLYALGLAMALWARRLQSEIWGGVTHVIDVLVFTLLLYLTDGPASPFLLFVLFALLSAGLRWRWLGVTATTIALLLLLLPTGFGVYETMMGGRVDMQRLVVRVLHVAVLAAIVAAFSLEQERIGRELLRIRSMPLTPASEDHNPVEATLKYAAGVLGADRAIMVWSDPDEPWVYLDEWRDGTLNSSRLPPGTFDPLVDEEFNDRPFLLGVDGGDTLYHTDAGRLAAWTGTPVDAAFSEHCKVTRAVAIPVQTETVDGWLFVTGKAFFSPEDLGVAGAIVAQIRANLDRLAALAAQQRAAHAEQRLRFARDLHDGVLQFLAGTAMQIEGILNAPADKPTGHAAKKLQAIQDALRAEQREVRAFIRQLRPGSAQPLLNDVPIAPDLLELVQRLREHWSIDINIEVGPEDALIPMRLKYDLLQLVREATANAVRHGQATLLDIRVHRTTDALDVHLSDNGSGLGVVGTFEAPRLAELKLGPRSLRERVVTLNGSFTLRSDSTGITIDAHIPVS